MFHSVVPVPSFLLSNETVPGHVRVLMAWSVFGTSLSPVELSRITHLTENEVRVYRLRLCKKGFAVCKGRDQFELLRDPEVAG